MTDTSTLMEMRATQDEDKGCDYKQCHGASYQVSALVSYLMD